MNILIALLIIAVLSGVGKKEVVIYDAGNGNGIRTTTQDYYTKVYVENRCRDKWVYVWIDGTGPFEFFPGERPIKKWVNGRPLDQSKIIRLDFGKHEIYAQAYLESAFGWYLVGTVRRTIKIDSHLGWEGYGETVVFYDWSFEECYVRRTPPPLSIE